MPDTTDSQLTRQLERNSMRKFALVTGATSGIGWAFAERLAADGYDLVIVGRRRERMEAFAGSHPDVKVRAVAADLSTGVGVDAVAGICAAEPLTMLVNNASGPAPHSQLPRRVVYAGTLAFLVAMSQTLSAELEGTGVTVQVVCPGVVATEFHQRQGMDLSMVPRMTAGDVVTASLRGLELGETVCAPGVEDASLLDAIFQADLAAFGAQSPQLATRYRAT